jgi:hypothetical protein
LGTVILGILGVAEPAVTIMGASIPTMRVLFKEWTGREAYRHDYRLSAFGGIRDNGPVHVDFESTKSANST